MKKNYQDCIKYTCIKCMNLPTKVKTIMSTLRKYTDTISHLCILLIILVLPKLLVFPFFR